VAAELLVDGAVGASPAVGAAVVLAAAVNGVAVVRAYFLVFTGGRHESSISLGITRRERLAVLTLAALILGGGLVPQPGVASRHRAAEAVLRDREARRTGGPPDETAGHARGGRDLRKRELGPTAWRAGRKAGILGVVRGALRGSPPFRRWFNPGVAPVVG
jgi:NADH-quinone oxidoreductase subunit M